MPKFHVGSGLQTSVIFIGKGSRVEAISSSEVWALVENRRRQAIAANRITHGTPVPNCAHLILPCGDCPVDCARRMLDDEDVIGNIPPMPVLLHRHLQEGATR